MSVSNAYVLHGVNTPSNFYAVLADATPTPLHDALVQFASGHPQPLFTATRGVAPEIRFTTLQCGTAFDEFGILGADLSAGNVDLYYRQATDLGTRDAVAAATAIRLRMTNAFAFIDSIQAGHRREASVGIRIVAPHDGSNAPIVAAGSTAIAGTSAAAEVYGLGPISINSSSFTGVQDLSVALNPDLLLAGDASELYETFAALRSIQPVVTLRGFDAAAWTTFALEGTALTEFTAYLRRKTLDGGNDIDGAGTHASIVGTDGIIAIEDSSGAGNTEVQTGLRCTMRAANSTSDVLTLAGSQNIS